MVNCLVSDWVNREWRPADNYGQALARSGRDANFSDWMCVIINKKMCIYLKFSGSDMTRTEHSLWQRNFEHRMIQQVKDINHFTSPA